MAVEIVGNPDDVMRYRKQLIARGMNTKRARMHPVYKNKPEDFRICQGSFSIENPIKPKSSMIRLNYKSRKKENDNDEEDTGGQGEEGTVSENAGYDPKRRLVIAGMANANIVDRMDERVDPKGGNFENFMKNPVLLADHMYWTDAVVGAVEELSPEDAGTGFKAVVGDPTKASLTKTQKDMRSLIAQKFIQTVSIGFIPQKIQAPTFDDQGRMIDPAVILQWELLELSIVAVPANPDATFEMKEFVENSLLLNASRSGSDKTLTSYGRNVKNEGSIKNSSGQPSGKTKKGLDGMDEEQVKELLEGIAGIAEGLSALAEMQKETLELLKATGQPDDKEDDDKTSDEDEDEDEDENKFGDDEDDEDDEDDDDDEKEKAFEALTDAFKTLKEEVKQISTIVLDLHKSIHGDGKSGQ